MYKNFDHFLEENADTRILRVVLKYAEGEDFHAKIMHHLPEDCRDRFVELWEESKKEVKALFTFQQSEDEWMEYDDLKQQREVLQNFVERYMERVGFSRHQDVGGTMLSPDGWNQYLRRVGRGDAKDREYCIRLCFVLRLSYRESNRLFEITGQALWERRDEREYMLCKMLLNGMYDDEVVDGYLLEHGMKQLFASSDQRKNQDCISEILNPVLAYKMQRIFRKRREEMSRKLCLDWRPSAEITDKIVMMAQNEPFFSSSKETVKSILLKLISEDNYKQLSRQEKEEYREMCERYISMIKFLNKEEVRLKVCDCCQMMEMTENEWYGFRGRMGGDNSSNEEKFKANCRTLCTKLRMSPEATAQLMKWAIVRDKDVIRPNG